jgi:hypothetical protein
MLLDDAKRQNTRALSLLNGLDKILGGQFFPIL